LSQRLWARGSQNLAHAFAAGLRFNVSIRDLQVKAYGDAAVATFYTEGVTTAADRATAQGIYWASYVWVKSREGWRIAHFHISPLVRAP
jgi:ketosteroid isomerase-like protein